MNLPHELSDEALLEEYELLSSPAYVGLSVFHRTRKELVHQELVVRKLVHS